MGLDLAISRLDRAIGFYIDATEKIPAEVVNKKMKDVLLHAVPLTPFVSPDKISSELRWQYATLALFKNGTLRKRQKALYKPTTLARKIIVTRLRKKGVNPRSLDRGKVDEMIENMISRRRSGAHFLQSGFIPAARAFGAGNVGVGFREAHGSGTIATPGNAVARALNDVTLPWKPDSPGYLKGLRALEEAFKVVADDTLDYADRLLADAWRGAEKFF